MTGKVSVIAHVQAKRGKEKEVREAMLALLAPTRKEKGCINYDLHESADNPALLALYENWDTKNDLDVHLAKPHIQGFLRRADELLAEPPRITLWKRIG